MKITFLGTGAADFLPSLKDTDKYTLSKNIRRSCVTLIDESTLIDCGPHAIDEIKLLGIDASRIKNIIITHNHSDHFNKENVELIAQMSSHDICLWHGAECVMPEINSVKMQPMQIENEYAIGDLKVTALRANHSKGSVHYSIESDGKRIFYGCDGAWILLDTFYYMKKRHYDLLILDATVGDYDGDYRLAEHNSIPMIRTMEKSFRTVKMIDDDSKIVLDHLARTLHKDTYEDICKCVEADGYIVAHDGMVMEI